MKALILSTLVLFSSVFAFAAESDEHGLSTIVGTNIDLKLYDHAFGGAINGVVAWGSLDESTFTSEMGIRKYGVTSHATFSKQPGKPLAGALVTTKDGQEHSTQLSIAKVDFAKSQIQVLINGELALVSITSDDFQNNHFINPTYTVQYKGETLSYKLTGQACYGMSSHFSLMILAAYFH